MVQLRLRVAFGLQTLKVKSRLLTGENTVRIRGNPPIQMRIAECGMLNSDQTSPGCCCFPFRTPKSEIYIQSADVAQQRQQQFRKLPGIAPRECESLHRLQFETKSGAPFPARHFVTSLNFVSARHDRWSGRAASRRASHPPSRYYRSHRSPPRPVRFARCARRRFASIA